MSNSPRPLAAKPLLRVLRGERLFPPPVWLMRQAGRYLPEYRTLRARTEDFLGFCLTPSLATEATLQPIRRYRLDGAILFSDILVIPWALGVPVRFGEGEGPQLAPLDKPQQIAALDTSSVVTRLGSVFETVARVRECLAAEAPDTALIGFAGGCFTVACYMLEGRASKDFATARAFAYAEPELFATLIAALEAATTAYLIAQAEAGAEVLMLFDSWAGLLSPNQFRRWVIEPTARIAHALRCHCPGIPFIGFPRLAGPMLATYAQQIELDAVGMDTAMDPRWAATAVSPQIALQGNLDPIALVAGKEALKVEVQSLLTALRDRPHIFNLGHGILPQTPPEHITALLHLIRTESMALAEQF